MQPMGSPLQCPLSCPLFSHLEVVDCPLSCPLFPYMEVVGSLICMAKFPWAAHGQPTPLPTELPTVSIYGSSGQPNLHGKIPMGSPRAAHSVVHVQPTGSEVGSSPVFSVWGMTYSHRPLFRNCTPSSCNIYRICFNPFRHIMSKWINFKIRKYLDFKNI